MHLRSTLALAALTGGPARGQDLTVLLEQLASLRAPCSYTVTEEYLKVRSRPGGELGELEGALLSALRDLQEREPEEAYDTVASVVTFALAATPEAGWDVLADARLDRTLRVNDAVSFHMERHLEPGTRHVVQDGTLALDYQETPGGRLTVLDGPVKERVPTPDELMSPLPVWSDEVRDWIEGSTWRTTSLESGSWLEYTGDDPIRYWLALTPTSVISWRQFDLHEHHLKLARFDDAGLPEEVLLVSASPRSISTTRWRVGEFVRADVPYPLGLLLHEPPKLQDLRAGRRDVYPPDPTTWPADVRDAYLFLEEAEAEPSPIETPPADPPAEDGGSSTVVVSLAVLGGLVAIIGTMLCRRGALDA